jgi:hypothetical protein
MPPEHVEMPGAAVVGNEMYPRLENRLPASVRRDHAGDRLDDLRAADAKALDVRPGQKPQPDPLRAHPLIIFGPSAHPSAAVYQGERMAAAAAKLFAHHATYVA